MEFEETDEFVFAMKLVDAGETAEPFGLAFRVQTDHDYLFLLVGWTFLAVVFRVLQSHLFSRYSDCLLYTSPSPRDLSTSRMPSSA